LVNSYNTKAILSQGNRAIVAAAVRCGLKFTDIQYKLRVAKLRKPDLKR